MRIATLQFAPKLSKVNANIDRANALLSSSGTHLDDIDLLVLPELAFSGYNHPSLAAILPFLEKTCSGSSTAWAKATAAKFKCVVSVGYPELYNLPTDSPPNGAARSTVDLDEEDVIAYNSTVTVSPSGQVLAHYRKTHLYYTDETWAKEGPVGFTTTTIKFPPGRDGYAEERKIAWGICMDLNPYKFTAPWDEYEFIHAALASDADMVVVSTAWLTSLSPGELEERANSPDMHTFSYWAERLRPLIEDFEKEVIVVVANRSGEEPGGTDHMRKEGVRYAGSSWVGIVGKGKIRVWKMLGRAEEGVLVADLKDGMPKHTFELISTNQEEDYEDDEDEEDGGSEGVDDG